MTSINITSNIQSVIADLDLAHRRQVPFAMSRAINDAALMGRKAVLDKAKTIFKFRTNPSWIYSPTYGWFRTIFSNKANLTATIEGLKDYLFLQEYSGVRTKRGGGMLAVPLGDLRKRAIPPYLKPKYLLGNDYGSMLRLTSQKAMSKKAIKAYGGGFIFKTNGKTFIVQRTGKNQLKFLYILVPSVFILERLKMEETVRAVVDREFNTLFAKRFNEAFATRK